MAKCTIDRYRRERDEQALRRQETEVKIARLTAEKAHWQDGRREGRREALSILLHECAESFCDNYAESHPIADTGDYSLNWNQAKLEGLFDCNSHESAAERLDASYWEHVHKIDCLEAKVKKLTKERDVLAEEIAKEQDQRIGLQLTLTSALEKLKAARSEIERKDAALRIAKTAIFEHHEIGNIKELDRTGTCPVCSKDEKAVFRAIDSALSPDEEGKESLDAIRSEASGEGKEGK